ncbi:DNA-processing protein DprA [Solidesulfovibrio magneticus]|uniref:SMF protein n=1 Tax=Solidesulfovibrio magneticus (strain ATCC 700980 / DSM 13731 / RS-1) TaxID=573370 RepID=C4XTH3_SOLM1|nr:DNA-processing protein DprA [Solidesulfovibrio magneticus]BAH75970.1 SMF protein [Solidesulfovibrio magneticus RS-1]
MISSILQFLQAKGSGEALLRRFLLFAAINGKNAAKSLCTSINNLSNELKINNDVASNIVNSASEAFFLHESLYKDNINVAWIGSDVYPHHLVATLKYDAPPVLFFKGCNKLFDNMGVGFCGSRKASEKGLLITRRCVELLVDKKICVTSGYAHGVDMAAHKTALKNGGKTIFVLVEGIMRFQHKREIAEFLSDDNYLAVSQFPPNLTWSARNAMKRNGTIIGLSDAMILVESGITGGTFAAGKETLQRGQPLFVIDYAAPGPSAEANPNFIKNGGIPIRGNSDGIPNLEKIFDITNQSRRNDINTKDLFTKHQSIKYLQKHEILLKSRNKLITRDT